MFDQFPKVRPALPEKIAEIYGSHYKENRDGGSAASSLSQKLESWLHRRVAEDVVKDSSTPRSTLEIGAGTLNQLQYEPSVGDYDAIEPFAQLYEGSSAISRVRNIYSDINDVPSDYRYDRITSVAVFEHICNLPEVIAKAALILKPTGVMRIAIPSEGTPLWTLGWRLTTGLEFRLRYGVDYGLLMKHEHVNTAKEIEGLLRYFFNTVECSVFGASKLLSLYQYYECVSPDLSKCEKYLQLHCSSTTD